MYSGLLYRGLYKLQPERKVHQKSVAKIRHRMC